MFRGHARQFGAHGLHLTQPAHLTGKFNGHLRLALFVFVDEGFWAGDKAAEGVLKGHITEPTITIEMKGREVYTATNRMKLAIASNGAWVIPAGNDERRYCVIDVPTTKVGDRQYFNKLHAWIADGGDARWLAYLLAHDLSEFDPRVAPSTAALDRQKLETMPPLDRWLMEALDQGTALAGHGDWLDDGIQVVCTAAVADYAEYCKRAGSRYTRADARVLGDRLRKVFGCGASCTVQSGGSTGRPGHYQACPTHARGLPSCLASNTTPGGSHECRSSVRSVRTRSAKNPVSMRVRTNRTDRTHF